jgi:hypothetical protein
MLAAVDFIGEECAGDCEVEVSLDKRYFRIIEIRLVTIPGTNECESVCCSWTGLERPYPEPRPNSQPGDRWTMAAHFTR